MEARKKAFVTTFSQSYYVMNERALTTILRSTVVKALPILYIFTIAQYFNVIMFILSSLYTVPT